MSASVAKTVASVLSTIKERERSAFDIHRAALSGAGLPRPETAPKGTFLHGFMLPFSMIVTAVRGPLRAQYLRVVLVRALVIAVVGGIAVGMSDGRERPRRPRISFMGSTPSGRRAAPSVGDVPADINIGNLHLTSRHTPAPPVATGHAPAQAGGASVTEIATPQGSEAPAAKEPSALADRAEVAEEPTAHTSELGAEHADPLSPAGGPSDAVPPVPKTVAKYAFLAPAWNRVSDTWARVLAILAILSGAQTVIVFLSRRWDDWLSFHASPLFLVAPEDAAPKVPSIALDVRWLYRKLKRRIRGYVVFAAGVPALFPLQLIPSVGTWMFALGLTIWGWYWLGVFAASKSAHAWADEATAGPPAPVRWFTAAWPRDVRLFSPLRTYARVWARLTRGVNAPALVFERNSASFLGLALARVILSLPGLYLLSRPLVPVAAGRLCAESDPLGRFVINVKG